MKKRVRELRSFFEAFGRSIQDQWDSQHRHSDMFSSIAIEELRRARPADFFDEEALCAWTLGGDDRPAQMDPAGEFSDAPFTVYVGAEFYVEVLHWMTASTSIHEHAFAGAWLTLEGSSIHTRWKFTQERRVSDALLIGSTAALGSELLERGDAREILPGKHGAHSLFHLAHPSVTLVARSNIYMRSAIQYDYRPPCLAVDPMRLKHERSTIGRVLAVFADAPEKYASLAISALRSGDALIPYVILEDAQRREFSAEVYEQIRAAAVKLHGSIIDPIHASVVEDARRQALTQRRAIDTDEDRRYLTALLLNVSNKREIVELLSTRHDGFSAEGLVDQLRALAAAAPMGVDWDETNSTLLQALITTNASEEFFDHLAREFGEDEVLEHRAQIVEHCQRMARNDMLRPLLGDHPALL